MANSSHQTAFLAAIVMSLGLTTSPLSADIITGSFDGPNTSGETGDTVIATIDFEVDDVADVTFETNFSIVDAGVRVDVNGMTLFSTGQDASEFGPTNVFTSNLGTNNLGNPFFDAGFTRLTVSSDSTGTSFTGNINPGGTVTPIIYTPGSSFVSPLVDFSSLLNPDSTNTIQIYNINNNGLARSLGDFTVESIISIPEPSALSLYLMGSLFCLRRKRQR